MLLRFFQHPAFLWVLAAVAIPLIIEWLLRRRRQRIPFAAMRFLFDSERPRKIKMQDRILLILRMIIIFLIILALARPLILPEDVISIDRKDRSVVLLFDSTYSNAQRIGNASSFQTGQRMANDVLVGLPEGVDVCIGNMGHSMKVVQDWTNDKALLREKIENMTVSHGAGGIASGLEWVLEKIKEKAGDSKGRKTEVFIFSDLQVQTWMKGGDGGQGKSASGLTPRLTEMAQLFVANTGGDNASNLFVTRFEPVDKILAMGVTTEFEVEVHTTGVEKGDSMPMRLTLYANDIKKRRLDNLEVPAEGAVFRVPYKVLADGEQVIKVVLDGDDSPLDNERLYLVEIPDAMKVLVLDDEGASQAYERRSVFWEYAVAPPSAPGRDPVSVFTVKTCHWGDAQKENFSDYGAVVLANIKDPQPGLVSRLEFYVKEGGSLLVFTGEGIESYPYESLYRDGKGVMPVRFKDKTEVTGFLKSLLPDSGEFDESGFRFARQLESGGENESLKTLAQLTEGQPLIVSSSYGQGRSLVIAMDPSLQWSHLPLAVDYPVFVQELLRVVLGDPNRFVNLSIGDVFSQPVLISTQHLLLKTPDRKKIRITPMTFEGEDIPRISFADTDVQGLYQLDAPPGVLARERFIVNLKPDEGDMTMMTESEFMDQMAKNVIFLSPDENVTKRVESMHALREFAGMILFLVFLLLLMESFLAMRFGLRKG